MSKLVVNTIENLGGGNPFNPTLGTAQDTSTGASLYDYTEIPSGVKQILLILDGVGVSANDELVILIGDAGGFETSGYLSNCSRDGANSQLTTGFLITESGASSQNWSGNVLITNVNGNTWIQDAVLSVTNTTGTARFSGGTKTLSAELDRLRLDTNGTDTFVAGQINIQYM